ncbi:hypothetical protein SAMN05720487_1022 [Fibrobacter sp. UWT2]|nr:hypothetical protein SAMN05720487_1022 [Fibrobacter sp. UWT2]
MNSEMVEKKAYVSPSMEEIDIACQSILCGSCDGNPDCMSTEIEGTP